MIFVNDLDLMARLVGLLHRRYRMTAPPMTISGKVAGAERQNRIDQSQGSLRGFDVMLMAPLAGGVGVTLTRANHVIHLDRWWNPAVSRETTRDYSHHHAAPSRFETYLRKTEIMNLASPSQSAG